MLLGEANQDDDTEQYLTEGRRQNPSPALKTMIEGKQPCASPGHEAITAERCSVVIIAG